MGVRAVPPARYFYRSPMLWMTVAFIAGIKLGQVWTANPVVLAVSLLVLLGFAFGLQRLGKVLPAGVLALSAMICFGVLYAIVSSPPDQDALARVATRKSEPIAVRCEIRSGAVWKPNANYRSQDPRSEPWQTQWDVLCDSVRAGHEWQPIAACATLSVEGRIDDFYPGDRIQVLGSYRRIPRPTNPGAFDFAQHFQQDAKFVSLSADSREQLELLDRNLSRWLPRCRAWLVMQVDHALHRWVAFGQAPLAAALVFGQREQVEWQDQQELMATGTLHLLAISGLHVEIVAGLLLLIAAPCAWRNSTLLIALVVVCGLYAALAGGKPPVLRAVLVVSAFALARTLGRKARLANVLGSAALVLLLLRVANIDSVGVHLSFLAVGTIGVFVVNQDRSFQRRSALQSLIEESLSAGTRWLLLCMRSIRNMCILSIWVWLLTCPLVWLNFHIVAPIAIPLNVFIAFPLMISLVAGLATGLLGWLPPLAWLTGMVSGIGLASISWIVALGQSIPYGHVWLPAPPLWWITAFYLTAAGWLLVFGKRQNTVLAGILFAWIAIGIAPFCWGPRGMWGERSAAVNLLHPSEATPVSELRCTFLDVGHGTSVIVELPTGAVWLYDAGHLGAADRSHQEIADALWQLPTARIDTLLISHADADHYNATQGLVERFRIARIASTRQFWASDDRDVIALRESLDGRGIHQIEMGAGSQGKEGDVKWQVLHPRSEWRGENDNATSMCFLLEYAGQRVLLPGDLEGAGLVNLVELPARPCHVLMAPHHGSTTLDPSELLSWCRPNIVVISGNHRATRAEVLDKYRTGGSQIGVTFRDGAIQIRITNDGTLSTWHWENAGWQPLD